MQDLGKLGLQIDSGMSKTKRPFTNLFFDTEISGSSLDTQDKSAWDGILNFLRSLRYFFVSLLGILVIFLLLVCCYCIRRERLKSKASL